MKFENIPNRYKGIIFIILSGLGFAFMSFFVKMSGDLYIFQKVLFRNLVSLVISSMMVIKHRASFIGKKGNRKYLFMRALFGSTGMVMNFYAIDHLVLSDASMLNKTAPFLVVLFSYIFLKEKITKNHVITIMIAFTGALFIVKPSFNVAVVPYLVALGGAVGGALAYTCIRKISGKEAYYTIVFFFSAFSVLMALVPTIINYEHMTVYQLGCLLLSGLSASLGQFGITLAYEYAPAREISIFDYSNVIFTTILGFIFFGETPDGFSFLGYLIIFAAAFYIFLYNKKYFAQD